MSFKSHTSHRSYVTGIRAVSLLWRVISFARAHLRILYAAQLHADLSKAAVAILIRRIVTEAVLGSDFVSHLSECRARVLKSHRRKILPTRGSRQFIHLFSSQIVELPANIHALERTHATKVLIIFLLGRGHKDLTEAFELFRR